MPGWKVPGGQRVKLLPMASQDAPEGQGMATLPWQRWPSGQLVYVKSTDSVKSIVLVDTCSLVTLILCGGAGPEATPTR
jgi:hypothetical protein